MRLRGPAEGSGLTCSAALQAERSAGFHTFHHQTNRRIFVALFIEHKLLKTVGSSALIGTQATCSAAAGKRKEKKKNPHFFVYLFWLRRPRNQAGDTSDLDVLSPPQQPGTFEIQLFIYLFDLILFFFILFFFAPAQYFVKSLC